MHTGTPDKPQKNGGFAVAAGGKLSHGGVEVWRLRRRHIVCALCLRWRCWGARAHRVARASGQGPSAGHQRQSPPGAGSNVVRIADDVTAQARAGGGVGGRGTGPVSGVVGWDAGLKAVRLYGMRGYHDRGSAHCIRTWEEKVLNSRRQQAAPIAPAAPVTTTARIVLSESKSLAGWMVATVGKSK